MLHLLLLLLPRLLLLLLLAFAVACWCCLPLLLQMRHPAFMYVVSELLKIFSSEPSADGSMGPILTALIGSSCQGLNTLQVSGELYCRESSPSKQTTDY